MISSAFWLSVLFLGIGILGVAIANRLLKLDNSALFGSLFFAPIIAYLVFSGQLTEVKGFGVEAKFREVAAKKIEIKAGSIDPVLGGKKHGELQSFFAGGSDVVVLNAEEAAKFAQNLVPIAFRVAEQISVNLLQGKFELLVVVDGQGVLIGSFPKSWFLDIPAIPDVHVSRGNDREFDQTDEKRMRRNLSKTLLWDILLNPRGRTKEWGVSVFIRDTSSQIDALRELNRTRVDALPVVDAGGKYRGIVRRADLETALIIEPLLGLSSQREPNPSVERAR